MTEIRQALFALEEVWKRYYGGPEGTSLPYKNLAISLKLCHPSLKIIVVFCVNVTVLYRNERLFLKGCDRSLDCRVLLR